MGVLDTTLDDVKGIEGRREQVPNFLVCPKNPWVLSTVLFEPALRKEHTSKFVKGATY